MNTTDRNHAHNLLDTCIANDDGEVVPEGAVEGGHGVGLSEEAESPEGGEPHLRLLGGEEPNEPELDCVGR